MIAESEGRQPAGMAESSAAGAQRLDKWLWFARVAKSRTLAAALVVGGKIRVNRAKAEKPSQLVRAGDVITSSAQRQVRILRVKAPGARRGPAPEASALYEELTPAPVGTKARGRASPSESSLPLPYGTGRPTKRDRRRIDQLKGRGQ
jgi:ribosome-associated heat shock protein Hsp15